MVPSSSEVDLARHLLQGAPRVVVMSGAGLSADAGLPAFCDDEGRWESHAVDELATPEAFARDARLVWSWYAWCREQAASCQPSAAHLSLARFALRHRRCLLLTQNVDGLHTHAARAVAAADDIEPAVPVELHGNIFWLRCTVCAERWEQRGTIDVSPGGRLPSCPACGGLARPHVIWFGEALERAQLSLALREAELAAVCLLVGTAEDVQTAASVAAVTAQAGGDVIEVDVCETPLTPLCSVSLRGSAAELLPAILEPDEDAEGVAGEQA